MFNYTLTCKHTSKQTNKHNYALYSLCVLLFQLQVQTVNKQTKQPNLTTHSLMIVASYECVVGIRSRTVALCSPFTSHRQLLEMCNLYVNNIHPYPILVRKGHSLLKDSVEVTCKRSACLCDCGSALT